MKFKDDQLALLKDFVNLMKLNPKEIHNPDLKFFKDWIERYKEQCSSSCTMQLHDYHITMWTAGLLLVAQSCNKNTHF